MGSFSLAVVLTLLLVVALAIVAVSILASAFSPSRRARRFDAPSDRGNAEVTNERR